MFSLTNKKMDQLLLDFVLLYFKLNFDDYHLNYYDKKLIEILEEYDFLIYSKSNFIKRSFND